MDPSPYNETPVAVTYDIDAEKYFPELKVKTVSVVVEGFKNYSDIKWNAMNGLFQIKNNGSAFFHCRIMPFTGNCGVKAITHMSTGSYGAPLSAEGITQAIFVFEDFLFHRCNAGILVGSDTIGGMTHRLIKQYGKDWVFGKPVWNPNYTWNKAHKIQTYTKYLNGADYPALVPAL